MATINIRSDVKDPFYRYKMERLQSKIEGKGNGIKTVIVNLSSVANSLARPGDYVIKYFGFELGAQTNTSPADDRWIINGAHEASKLQDYLDGFINKFVLCKKCKNPETDVVIKDGNILLDCKACGQRSNVDLRLKLSGFILKKQPKKGKKDKADRKAARKAKENGNGDKKNGNGSGNSDDANSENGSNGDGDVGIEAGSDDEFTRGITNAAQDFDDEAEVKDVEWTVDMSAEAIKARQQQLPDDLKQKLVLNGDDEDEEGEGGGNSKYDQLLTWVNAEVEEKGGVDKVDDLEIYLKAKELGIENKHRTLTVLLTSIFDDDIAKQIPKRAGMLKNIGTSEKHQRAILGGVERFIGSRGKDKPEIYEQTSKVLLVLYNEDLLTEEVITKWGTKASRKHVDLSVSKKVRKSAEAFLNWLAEAESDDDSE
ncbi:ARM repeat-containing protein [Glarea lozoyensis ATCC 20868]|uniref:ARM repeat-containing protein n=2 Tax=Glarea lozoyensis TaxID=101852 RepID=S3CGG2_GLAL2|nr:ARM repeat-containing protein [Glarea lozoyensis ATCC 20868]EHL01405.1 putative Eukaryotic translation initiation factor 5 [Glarea lozoyensis 74030]EPE24995.1 ARM repeat-containing protein [Glarea lozoyensis ATCC 20868]